VKILIVADYENNNFWRNCDERWNKKLSDIDLVLSAGDLAPAYLEFIVDKLHVPLLYVRGNHDSFYDTMRPKGCMDIDGKVVNVAGLRIAGLGGSMRYREGSDMYSEKEQNNRIQRLKKQLQNGSIRDVINKDKLGSNEGHLDIFLTHAPCSGHGDLDDLPHKGFACFNTFIEQFKPRFHLYGHIHMDYGNIDRVIIHHSGTTLINCCGMYILELKNKEELL